MTLNASGPISLGGSTAGQSINLELGKSATALASINATDFRTLAGVPSGQISLASFYGKSNISGWFAIYADVIPSVGGNWGAGVCVDASNNLYANGAIQGQSGGLFVKVNSSGTLVTTKRYSAFAAYAPDYPCQMVVDSSSNIYTAINYNNVPGLLKTDSSFTFSSGCQFLPVSGADSAQSTGLVQDSSGNIYWTQLGANNGSGLYSAALARLNSSLAYQSSQAHPYGYTTTQNGGVAIDGSGNYYVSTNGNDVYKYNSSNTIQWITRLSGSFNGKAIACDSSGNTYVVGNNGGGTGVYCILVKLNSSGAVQWSRKLTEATTYGGVPNKVIVGSDGNIYVCGRVPVSAYNYYRGFIAKYNSSGTIQWQRYVYNPNVGSFYISGVGVQDVVYSSVGLAITGAVKNNANDYSNFLIGLIPADGAGVNTYSVGGVSVTYVASTNTEAAAGITGSSASETSSGANYLTARTGSALTSTNTVTKVSLT